MGKMSDFNVNQKMNNVNSTTGQNINTQTGTQYFKPYYTFPPLDKAENNTTTDNSSNYSLFSTNNYNFTNEMYDQKKFNEINWEIQPKNMDFNDEPLTEYNTNTTVNNIETTYWGSYDTSTNTSMYDNDTNYSKNNYWGSLDIDNNYELTDTTSVNTDKSINTEQTMNTEQTINKTNKQKNKTKIFRNMKKENKIYQDLINDLENEIEEIREQLKQKNELIKTYENSNYLDM